MSMTEPAEAKSIARLDMQISVGCMSENIWRAWCDTPPIFRS